MGPLGGTSFGYRGEDEQDLLAPCPVRVVNALLTRKRAKEKQNGGAEGLSVCETPSLRSVRKWKDLLILNSGNLVSHDIYV